MDWANERYVRLFVRDTATWKLLPWQSRLLLPAIMRKLDRAGVIDLGEDGEEGLAALVEVPLEFLQAGLPPLLKRGVFQMARGKFVMPNFLAAQEAKQSDAQRKRESRENQRLVAMRPQLVTDGHEQSQPVTNRDQKSQAVTGCPERSQDVTPDQSDPGPDPRLDQSSPRDPCTAAAPPKPLGKIRPDSANHLEHCLRVAVERAQPQAGRWIPGRFSDKDADKLLRDIGDVTAALPELERKIAEFAKDPDMQPWTMARFVDKYNAIGLPKMKFGRAEEVKPQARY